MKNKTPTPYDDLFKDGLIHPQMMRELLEDKGPQDIVGLTNLATLRLCPQEHKSKWLKNRNTDVVYAADTYDGQVCYFYYSIEQQRDYDKKLPWRVHLYRVHLIEEHFKKHPDSDYLPLIYQLVIHNGKVEFHGPRSLKDMVYPKYRDIWQKYWDSPFDLLDLHHIDEMSLIEQQKTHNLLLLLLSPRFIQDPYHFIDYVLPELLKKVMALDFHGFNEAALHYVMGLITKKDYTNNQIDELDLTIRNALPTELEGEYMGLEQRWEEKGIEKGMQQGMLIGEKKSVLKLHRKGHAALQIAEWLDMELSAVKKIINEEK